MNKPEKRDDQEIPKRKPYSPPRLQRWGDLKEITQGGGGMKGELSKKATRF